MAAFTMFFALLVVSCAAAPQEKVAECFPGYFQCATGVCIPESEVCNGVFNCTTGEDELNCAARSVGDSECFPGYYTCETGNCIPESKVCDGVFNCVTGDDERNCPGEV